MSPANGALALFNKAPHPNAAKVYINWLLSKEGQTVFAARQRLRERAFGRAHRSCGALASAAARRHQDLYEGRPAGEGQSDAVADRGVRQPMSQTFLEVRNLVKIFGKLTAVDNVSFKVEQGEVVTLLGPSGCGKTTTLRMVAGFEKPNAGEVEIAGRVVVATNRRINVPPERRDIGMVFQSYAIWPHMTVFENVAFPLNVRRANRQEIKRRVERNARTGRLGEFLGSSGDSLERRTAATGVAGARAGLLAEHSSPRRAAQQFRRQAARADAHRDQAIAAATRIYRAVRHP